MTAFTPIYRLAYIEQGEPIRNTRQALEDNAYTIEAALQAGGLAPQQVQDMLTALGETNTRLDALQADLDTFMALHAAGVFDDTGWLDIPLGTMTALNTAERPQIRRVGRTLHYQGGISAAGLSPNTTYSLGAALTDTRLRPAQNAIVQAGSSVGEATASLLATAGGEFQVRTGATLGAYYKFDALSGVLAQ